MNPAGDAAPPARWAQAADWPNRDASRFLRVGPLTWHVQVGGADTAPVMLLLHGTGASTHSWRGVWPYLVRHFRVVAPDLPGHGFTSVPGGHRLSLPAMARDLAGLLDAIGSEPALAVGHSAGAAVLARMCIDRMIAPAGLVSLNGAFMPLAGPAGQVFAPLARLLVGLPVLPQLFAWRAGDPRVVERLLAGTGSRLDAAGVGYYARLVREPGHAAGALRMMANWDLVPVVRDLPRLATPLLLVAADNDRAIPPRDADRVAALVPHARVIHWAGLGHLAHEEAPERAAAAVEAFARSVGAA